MKNVLDPSQNRVVIIGGGPGGYEAALVAGQLGADVMLIERNRCGGSAVLTDVVPSKTLIATAELMGQIEVSGPLGIHLRGTEDGEFFGCEGDGREFKIRALDAVALVGVKVRVVRSRDHRYPSSPQLFLVAFEHPLEGAVGLVAIALDGGADLVLIHETASAEHHDQQIDETL